jgi:CDGSH-type Zn-finger protein
LHSLPIFAFTSFESPCLPHDRLEQEELSPNMSETIQPIIPASNAAFTAPNGPLIATGDLRIEIAGAETLTQPKASLCRCGASSKKPFCDGTHRTIGYQEAGEALPAAIIGELTESGPVTFTPAPNGPLLAKGPLTVQNAAKQTIATTTSTAFCRCGASKNTPYCDGSHKAIGFQA